MKSFKQMMAEVAEPKSPEEKRFKDQHVIQKFDHPAAEDSQFTGEITGKTKQKRLADQEGDADYDQAYSQRKDGKAKLESVEEDGKQLDEISKSLAGRYIKKAQMDTAHAGDQIATGSMGQAGASPDVKKGYEKQRKKGIAKLIRRRVGTRNAVAKLTGTARVAAKEEVEQIDEISQETLRQYHGKAGADLQKRREKLNKGTLTKADLKKGQNRVKGLNRAANKMEEVELSENPMEEKPMMMNALRAMSHNIQGIAAYVSKTPDPEEWFQNKLAGVAKEMQTLYGYATAETMAMGEAKTDEELKGDQHKLDHNKNGKIDAHDFKMLRKKKQKTESVELEEAVKQGNMKLRDGSSVKVSKQDAGLINQMMKDLNPANRRKMEKVMMTDKAGFEEIVGFAREAL